MTRGNPIFQTKRTYLIDQAGACGDEQLAAAMERLQVDLLGVLDLYKVHRRACDGFGNRLSVDDFVLVGLHVGLHELRRNDADLVSHCDPGHASMPIRARGTFKKKFCTALRLSLIFLTGWPLASTPTT